MIKINDILKLIKQANNDALVLLILLVVTVTITIRNSKIISNKYIPICELLVGISGGVLIYLAFPKYFDNLFIPIIDGIIAGLIDNVGNKIYEFLGDNTK